MVRFAGMAAVVVGLQEEATTRSVVRYAFTRRIRSCCFLDRSGSNFRRKLFVEGTKEALKESAGATCYSPGGRHAPNNMPGFGRVFYVYGATRWPTLLIGWTAVLKYFVSYVAVLAYGIVRTAIQIPRSYKDGTRVWSIGCQSLSLVIVSTVPGTSPRQAF